MAFLQHDHLAILKTFYSSIRVVYIPRIDSDRATIALEQLDAFGLDLREKHRAAFERRRQFFLNFEPERLTSFLQRALDRLSNGSNAVLNWALEAPPAASDSAQSQNILVDLWSQYLTTSTDPQIIPYNRVLEDFRKHITFCLRLRLKRNPFRFDETSEIPPQWEEQIDQLTFQYASCGAVNDRIKCEKVRYRHGDYHEESEANRWSGEYTPERSATSQQFSKFFKGVLQSQGPNVSLDDLRKFAIISELICKAYLLPIGNEVPKDIQSVVSCLGCLQHPPSTLLACGHGFCFDCVRDLTHDESLPHRLNNIRCPIHGETKMFSPRLLPIQSGYRILSLDGGGVKGLGQLVMLSHIEKKCFNVPVIHLFDLMVGTSIGGLVALALTIGKPSGPLTAAAAKEEFPGLIRTAFNRKPTYASTLGKTLYKTQSLEKCLKSFFGEEAKLYSASSSPWNVPNVAVTTTVDSSGAYLVTN